MTTAAPPRPTTLAEHETATETDSARRGGGPQGRALYECACGTVFTATVTTSVGCPTCGGGQAW